MRISDLIVIEAPGKIPWVSKHLRHLGFADPKIIATHGELLRLPKDHLGVDLKTFKPLGYEADRPRVIDDLIHASGQAEVIWLATDADVAGEVIADQVRQLTGHRDIRRVLLPSYHKDDIIAGFKAYTKIDPTVVRQGISRRVSDRLIGYAISDPSQPYATGIVGRVITSTLHSLSVVKYSVADIVGRIGNFDLSGAIPLDRRSEAEELLSFLRANTDEILSLPTKTETVTIKPLPPCTGAEAILLAARSTNIPVTDAAARLQSLYEAGKLTYPRSDSRHLSFRSRSVAVSMARNSGYSVVQNYEQLYRKPNGGFDAAHECVMPTEAVDIRSSQQNNSESQQILSALGERAAEAFAEPAVVKRLSVDEGALRDMLERGGFYRPSNFAIKLTEDTPVSRSPWLNRSQDPSPRLRWHGADEVLLRVMIAGNHGRPASQLKLIKRMIDRKFVDKNGALTNNGLAALSFAKKSASSLVDVARSIYRNTQDEISKEAASNIMDIDMSLSESIEL